MNDFHLRFEQARDEQYWKQLNPALHITNDKSLIKVASVHIDSKLLDEAKESLQSEGYFQLNKLLSADLVDKLADGVERVYKAGWPTPFVIVYDEYWEMFYQLKQLFEAILGEGYKQVPNFWCWYVDANKDSKGWGHHRDRPSVDKVLNEDGSTSTLTTWIALTDATPANGCIYIVPSNRDPYYPPGDSGIRDVYELQNIRALPANAGDVLGWTEALLHWGSRSSNKATNPRVSISFTFQRADKAPFETPLFEPSHYQLFDERLGLIAQNVWNYRANAHSTPEVLFACQQLSGLIPTISYQNSVPREVLEEDTRLSHSMLWKLQEEYFEKENLNAWKKVPFRITSRMPFVESYFELIKAFLLDSAATIDFDSPLYILELGGGSGCFAHRFLNLFEENKNDLEILRKLKLKYVLSDFSEVIVRNYLQNKNLSVHREKGTLDFSAFRPEDTADIKLVVSNETIAPGVMKNPLIVIANYVFDTIKHDAFRVNKGVLQETKFTLFRDENKCSLQDEVRLEDVELIERYVDTSDDYYSDPVLNSILDYYKTNLDQASVIFPVGTFNAIKNLTKLSGGNLTIIAADKGFTDLSSSRIQGLQPHQFSRHGSFSCDVNFDAITRYFKNTGGATCVEKGDNADLSIMFATTSGAALELTKHFCRQQLHKKRVFDSGYQLEEIVREGLPTSNSDESIYSLVKKFLAIVRGLHFEPVIFTEAYDALIEARRDELIQLEETIKEELEEVMLRVAQHIYVVDEQYSPYDAMLRIYFALAEFQKCLELSEHIIDRHGEVRTALDHAALSSERVGNLEQSHGYFQRSFNLDRTNEWALKEMLRVREKLPKTGDSVVRISVARPK